MLKQLGCSQGGEEFSNVTGRQSIGSLVWIELSAEQQDDITEVKAVLKKAMMPMNFVPLYGFITEKTLTRQSHHTNDWRKLLTHAIPDMAAAAKEPLHCTSF